MNRLRVVLDANVLAPGLVSDSSSSAEIVRYWNRGLFDVLISGKLVGEVAKTLRALGFDGQDIGDFIGILGSSPDMIVPLKHQIFDCGDPDDDYLFEMALDGEAAILVTRDKQLLRARPAALEHMLDVCHIRVMSDLEVLDYIRGKVFSPMVAGARHFLLGDIVAPLSDVACVLCGHGFHWNVDCGDVYYDETAEPAAVCACPAKVGLQPV